MKLKQLLALLLCLTFVLAVLTGCGGSGEPAESDVTSYETEELDDESDLADYETEDLDDESDMADYVTEDPDDESEPADNEAEDLSAELDFKVFCDGSLKAAFVDGDCFIDLMDGGALLQAVDKGPYTWDGMSGTIDGAVNDLTFTIEDGVLLLVDEDGEVYALPAL